MSELLISDSDGSETRFELTGPVVFGRTNECSLVLSGEGMSRRHGRFVQDDRGHWWVEDLGSKNGILVNSRKVTKSRVVDGDVLSIGDLAMTFVDPASAKQIVQTVVTLSQTPFDTHAALERGPVSTGAIEARRLAVLYDISRDLLQQKDVSGLIETACSALIGALDAGVVVAGLTCDPQRDTDLLFVRPVVTKRSGVTLSASIVRRVVDTGKSILVSDTGSDEHLKMAQSIVSGGICSALCVPLLSDNRVTGFVYVDSRRNGRAYTEQDLDCAAAIGALVGTAVEMARLHEADLARQRMEAELSRARRVQQAIMPSTWPAFDGWEIHGHHETCREVGGDYYDAVVTPRGLWLLVADVSGKGASAALLASSLHTAVQALVEHCFSPAELLSQLNRILLRRKVESAFVTCLAVLIPQGGSEITLASAGHPQPILLPRQGVPSPIEIEPGFMLGMFDTLDCADLQLPMPGTGDALLLYTDGVTEALNADGQLFGEERLRECMPASGERTAADLVESALRAVEGFRGHHEQSDDLTIVACRRTG